MVRRAHDNGFLLNGKGKVCAINLGADFVSEHEWGIKEIKRRFGIPEDQNILGIERRRISKIPESFQLLKTDAHWTLTSCSKLSEYELDKGYNSTQEIYTAWNERDFAVRVYSDSPNAKKNKKHLEKMFEAFHSKRVAIWIGGGGVFQNGGLLLAIIDRLPQDKLQIMKEADIEKNRLNEVAEKINKDLNLKKRLQAAGKDWFALTPQFHYNTEDWSKNTSFEIIYWLNPLDQKNNKSGYVTVEDLIAWSKNKGPIIETNPCNRYAGIVNGHMQKGLYEKK